tara:strand:+ start:693 stop:1133 length:441 start_codon:yes stop_codon:yes gene_type:complete
MIYWFTGQPGAGKTVLADLLKQNKFRKAYRIDGDQMRDLFSNKDYSIKGRIANIDAAQKISHYLHNQGQDVIVSLVSPYLDQREEFKEILGSKLVEFYIHTTSQRGREKYHVEGYQKPNNHFTYINTTIDTPIQSLKKIISSIEIK